MFFKCKNEREVKELYRKLALKLHPDHGGCSMLFNLLQDAKDNMIRLLAKVEKNIEPGAFKTRNRKYENQIEDVYAGDECLEIIKDFRKYKEKVSSFSLSFLESLEDFLSDRGYLTSIQYNCLVKTYYAFRMWEKIED